MFADYSLDWNQKLKTLKTSCTHDSLSAFNWFRRVALGKKPEWTVDKANKNSKLYMHLFWLKNNKDHCLIRLVLACVIFGEAFTLVFDRINISFIQDIYHL